MSICYWGDKFYGIDRIEYSHFFDINKERKLIIKALVDIWDEEEIVGAIQDNELCFNYPDEVETDNGIEDLIGFLDGTGVTAYCPYTSNGAILFFGINFMLPWEIKKVETKDEVDLRIYNSLKPILKSSITFEKFQEALSTYIINGADDYVTYYGTGK